MVRKRYAALRIVALLLSLLGVLTLLLTLLVVLAMPQITERAAAAFFKGLDFAAKEAEKEGDIENAVKLEETKKELKGQFKEWKGRAATGARFLFLLYGLFLALGLFASGELLRLMMAVEEETRILAETFEKKRV